MKAIDPKCLDGLPGRRLAPDETFDFACHPALPCFNRCCRNLNLFLYPYDVLRLRRRLEMDADGFLDRHVDLVLRPGHAFPDVLLRMGDDAEKACPFLTEEGCRVYADRPFTCRSFPLEKGLAGTEGGGRPQPVYFFRPPDFCCGPGQRQSVTARRWFQEPDTARYDQMTERWAMIAHRLGQPPDPWAGQGPEGQRARMVFMAAYNPDALRRFVFESSFLRRFKVPRELQRRIARDDERLLVFGFEWIELFVWGARGKNIRPKT